MPEIVIVKEVHEVAQLVHIPGLCWCSVPGLVLVHVEVPRQHPQQHRHDEEHEAEEPHHLPPERSLAFITLTNLNSLPDHVVGDHHADISGENEEDW